MGPAVTGRQPISGGALRRLSLQGSLKSIVAVDGTKQFPRFWLCSEKLFGTVQMSPDMPLNSQKLWPEVRQALTRVAASAHPDPNRSIGAFNILRDLLRRRLEPIFGSGAVDALFARSTSLAANEFRWLNDAMPNGARPFRETPPPANTPAAGPLLDGLVAVLSHDIALLIAFVGEDFVMPIVRQAWATGLPNTTDESE
jgi:hypothetical protein